MHAIEFILFVIKKYEQKMRILYPFKLKIVDHLIIDLNIQQISDVPNY